MTIWIVYQAADRLIVGVFGTAADAAARVSAGTGLVATAGLTTAAALEAQPGQYYLANRTIASDKPLSDVELLQQRVWQVHTHLINLWGLLQIEAAAHPWGEMIKVHDYFARIHPTLFYLLKTNGTQRTLAQRLVYATAMLAGPQHSGSAIIAPVLFSTVAGLTNVGTVQGVSYVNPLTNAHVSIADSLDDTNRNLWGLGSTMAPLVVTEQQLSSGGWINTIS